MKVNTRLTILAAAFAMACAFTIGFSRGLAAGVAVYLAVNFAFTLLGSRHGGAIFNPSLIFPILTGKVFEAFKPTSVPELDFISTDWGKTDSGFAQPVKFGQEVVSQLALVPQVTRTTPGGLLTSPVSSTSNVIDLSVTIDRMAACKIRLPSADIEQLLASPAFIQSLKEGSQALARFVFFDALMYAGTSRVFTNQFVAATPDVDTLETARTTLNTQLAAQPRFGLVSTAFASKVAQDPRVMLSYGLNQRVGGDAFASFQNLFGLSVLREVQQFPNGNRTIGTFTADHTTNNGTYTIATLVQNQSSQQANIDPVIDFANGVRVQVSSSSGAGDVPAGLDATLFYYVINYTPDPTNGVLGGSGVSGTFQLSATVGGANVNITGNGSGTLTLTQAENLEGLFFEKRGIHVCMRPMIDPTEAAKKFGIPQTILVTQETDPVTGINITAFMWQDTKGSGGNNPTLDVFGTFVIQYGIRGGRHISLRPTVSLDPTTAAAGTGMDPCAVRVITG